MAKKLKRRKASGARKAAGRRTRAKPATRRSRKLVGRRPKNRTTDLVTARQIRPKQAEEDFRLFDSFLKIFEPTPAPRKK